MERPALIRATGGVLLKTLAVVFALAYVYPHVVIAIARLHVN